MAPRPDAQPRQRIVYLHRYPIEVEAVYFSALRPLLLRLAGRCEFCYLSMKGMGPPDPELRKGIRVYELPFRVDTSRAWSKWTRTLLYYLCFPFTLRKIRQLEPDLIVCKEILPLVPCWLARLQTPLLITICDWWLSTLLGGSTLGRKVAFFLERAEVRRWNRAPFLRVFANSRTEACMTVHRGVALHSVQVVNAAFTPGEYKPCDASGLRRALGLTGGEWTLAIHGNIRPGKGYGQLLEWWRDLAARHPHWRLLIVGGAGGEDWCRRHVRQLGLESNVIITGWLPSAGDINQHLNAADCLLVMRRNSNDNLGAIPSGLYHSLATGKPTVATGLPGMAEVIEHGVTGYLYTPDDPASFQAVLERVADHPGEAARVGQAGILRCEECFDPGGVAARYLDVIDGLARGRDPAAP